MEYSPHEQYRRAEIIVDAVCKVGGINYFQLLSAPKSEKMSTLRGLCCVAGWEFGVHARRMAKMIHRTRGNVLNMQRKYRGLIVFKDALTVSLYGKVMEEIKRNL